ncbi:SAM-dependent methyltransferase [Wenzhouxiangella marina]|uniref:Cyclopropane-fatty-acyl-phospholipid synthase n=1 Tax=Wenzhouxiangella marina TaxID=1579979 RepID=A0A0K0XXB4_9GAMM|nr:cyclopropane-fatty-acyl-phospholipid synthase family protein [Wenzhouxiangella marina]AKS42272.1 cyclopropane-fatty-acyl-phospholipid synthase [Wenzhouxiangella marina]MBB6085955.1 cyclopropane-fatty-acyl-phospholipid synthase [Wenzhouxiangella marina]
MTPIELAEKGLAPDWLIRRGIRRLLAQRLRDEFDRDPEQQAERTQALMNELAESAIAIETDAANEQHYEVPAAFYKLALGARLKYSSALYPPGVNDLDTAEEAMLEASCAQAELADGQRVLELGCGWGSLTLWMASQYPNSRITAVSNSASQRAFIEQRALELGLHNVEIRTCDVNQLELDERFDRVVSVEMFEHVRNYRVLLNRIAGWLKPEGKLFVHIFCHRYLAYPFETEGEDNWMGRYFFTGGLMPAADTLLHFQDDLALEDRKLYSGTHYARTSRAWLDNMDARKDECRQVMQQIYGDDGEIWRQRWRMFFMACEELFGYDEGNAWMVAHYRFRRR